MRAIIPRSAQLSCMVTSCLPNYQAILVGIPPKCDTNTTLHQTRSYEKVVSPLVVMWRYRQKKGGLNMSQLYLFLIVPHIPHANANGLSLLINVHVSQSQSVAVSGSHRVRLVFNAEVKIDVEASCRFGLPTGLMVWLVVANTKVGTFSID